MGCWVDLEVRPEQAGPAQQFLVDLAAGRRERLHVQSQLYNFPTFPGDGDGVFKEIRKFAAAGDTHKPKGKYTILTTIAERYTNNIGYPGTTNAGIDEIFQKFLIPQMFAQVSQGKLGRGACGPHEHRDQEHLREVAEARDALSGF